jgi:hypothetical protein
VWPIEISCARKNANNDIARLRMSGKKLATYRAKTATNRVANHGIAHRFRYDETESGNGRLANVHHHATRRHPGASTNCSAEVRGAHNPVLLSEHARSWTGRAWHPKG